MASSNSSSGGGIGFVGPLTIVLITLKLTGHIDWSWFWVLSPLLIPVFILVFLALVVLYLEGLK